MRTIVGVLRGGPSNEYDVSLKSGAAVLGALNAEKYEPRDVFISRDGQWHMHGVPVSPEQALRGVDVAFNAMHGEYGEDGGVQRTLDVLQIPYTGSGASASALAFNKHKTKEIAKQLGVKVAHSITVSATPELDKMAFAIFRSFPHPAIVKPVVGGSSIGTTFADSYHALRHGLEKGFEVAPEVLVEEYIKGREATVGVIEDFRNEKLYLLLPTEAERSPGNFSHDEKHTLMNAARAMHEGLSLSQYSRSDFIVSKRGIYFLETNTLPGLTEESLLPKALKAVGAKLSDFLDHLISLARRPKIS
jgi:D-alanine-D-alanine ligase